MTDSRMMHAHATVGCGWKEASSTGKSYECRSYVPQGSLITLDAGNKEETGMSWARFDDNYSLNPKILAAGPWCELLDVRAIIWCARYETDGFVSYDSLSIVGLSIPSVRAKAKKLVEVGRWTEGDGGWWIVHYLTYNPSHEECERRRKEGKERAARSRERKANERRTFGVGSGDPRGGDGIVISSVDELIAKPIEKCVSCADTGWIYLDDGVVRCDHGQNDLKLVRGAGA